jgi:hypothetical protein
MCRSTNRPGDVEPKVCFRIAHIARDGHHGNPMAAYSEQNAGLCTMDKEV